MSSKQELEQKVLMAAADNGINSILFRNAMARKLGLSTADASCLNLLGIKGISTPTELARYTGLTTGSTTAMLDRLERKGIITRKANPKDRRGVIIEINQEYAVTSKQLVQGIQKSQRELISTYSEAELQTITDFLTRFTQNIVKHTEELEG